MPIDTDQTQEFTDDELLSIARNNLAKALIAQEYTEADGRRLKRPDLDKILDAIERIEDRANAAENGGIGLVKYGERI